MIVRIFEPAPDAGTVALRGVVEDVRTGSSIAFHGESDLLAVLLGAACPLPQTGRQKSLARTGSTAPTGVRHRTGDLMKETSDEHDP